MTDILFAGGGSSGHLTPSIAVADAIRQKDPSASVHFIIADRDDERDLASGAGVPFSVLHAGKFPRGISIRILTYPILAVVSFIEAFILLLRLRPKVVFSKGGFVSVPVTVVAWVLHIPVVLHSSDSVPSMSDRFIGSIARTVCTGFPPDQFPTSLRKKAVYTGNPVRALLATASRDEGRKITGFSGDRPVLMIIGGSQGSLIINRQISSSFDELLGMADVIHLTGKGKGGEKNHARYFSRSSVLQELPHLYALADLVVTRAGAGVLSELAALSKPAIVVPLAGVAHDHQVRNGEALADSDACALLLEEKLSDLPSLVNFLLSSPERRTDLGKNLHAFFPDNAATKIATILLDALRDRPLQS